MSTQYGNPGETGGSAGAGAGESRAGNSALPSGATAGDAPDLNMGSARSDYGERAYGGSLDEQGLGGRGYDDFSEGRGSSSSSSAGTGGESTRRGMKSSGAAGDYRRSGYSLETGSTGLTLLAGMVIGATLMYIFDPQQGGRRRALLRDKLVGLSNDAADVLGKTSRDLRNRAQGVIAETTKAIGLGAQGESGSGGGDAQGQRA